MLPTGDSEAMRISGMARWLGEEPRPSLRFLWETSGDAGRGAGTHRSIAIVTGVTTHAYLAMDTFPLERKSGSSTITEPLPDH